MPQIPVYNSPQVDRADVPGVRQSVGGVNAVAFGASNTFDQLGDMANVVIQQQAKEGERKAAEDAMRAQSEFQREVIGKQNEWRQRQGKNAEGVDKEADAWMEETADKYIKGLKDPRAVQLFDQKAMQQRTNMLDWATGHVTQQREVALDVEFNSAKQVAMDTALNDSRPQIVNQSIADIRQKNAFMAKHKGYDDNWLQAQNSNDIEKLHGGILQNAMDQDSVSGVAGYLQAHGSEMDAGMRGKAEKWIHKKTIDETAGAYADELIQSGVSYSEALAGARERFSGDDEDKYIRRINELYGEQQEMKNLYVRETNDRFEKLAYEKGVDKLTDDDLDALAEKDAGTAARWKQLRNDALEVKAVGGQPPKYSNQEYLAEANMRLNSDGPDRITNQQQLAQYRMVLSPSDYKTLESGLDDKRKIKESDILEAYKIFAPDGKRKQDKWDTTDWADYFAFKQMAQDAVRDTANPDYVGKLSAEWWLNGKVKGTGYDLPIIGEVGAKTMTKGKAMQSGKMDAFAPVEQIQRNAITEPGLQEDARQQQIQEAMKWIEANPNDPRVPAIKQRLGI